MLDFQVNLKREGLGSVDHYPPIADADIEKLYSESLVFSTETPTGLQQKVFFEIMLYLCKF